MDPIVFGARWPRAGAHADGAQSPAHAAQKQDSCHVGEVWLYGQGASDAFGKKGREIIEELLLKLPPHTQQALRLILDELDHVTDNLKVIEGQMIEVFSPCPQTHWLTSLPGVGNILAVVIWSEIGTIERFNRAEQLASYSGLVSRESSTGGKIRLGPVRRDVNVYLKWAFVEAANSSLLNAERCG